MLLFETIELALRAAGKSQLAVVAPAPLWAPIGVWVDTHLFRRPSHHRLPSRRPTLRPRLFHHLPPRAAASAGTAAARSDSRKEARSDAFRLLSIIVPPPALPPVPHPVTDEASSAETYTLLGFHAADNRSDRNVSLAKTDWNVQIDLVNTGTG